MKKLIIGTLAAALMAGTAFAGEMQKVRMGTEGAYAPYNFVNDKGEIDGFERELGDKLCAIAKLDCTWVKNDWDSIIPNLVSGNYDTIMAGMSITPERDKTIDFTQEYFPADPSAYMALKGASASVVKGVVAAQKATIQAGYVATSGATVVEFDTADETIAAVKSGEADAVLADRAFLKKFVDESKGELVFIGEGIPIGGGVGMGLRESDGELKARFNAAITAMKKDGSLSALIAKWFDGRKVTY
jgi:polar amino acid transport system substrate-binding protein